MITTLHSCDICKKTVPYAAWLRPVRIYIAASAFESPVIEQDIPEVCETCRTTLEVRVVDWLNHE
jgi:hypothetical protein